MTRPATLRALREQPADGEEPERGVREPLGLRTYVSLGDSISIDLYPGLDVAEREGLSLPPAGLGAASLLHRNDDGRWPLFGGRDLRTRCPGIRHLNLTEDGATTGSVLQWQLPRIPADLQPPVLVTLTAGGNDLVALLDQDFLGDVSNLEGQTGDQSAGGGDLAGAGASLPAADDAAGILAEETAARLALIVRSLRERLPEAVLLVGTVYDPSDGTGDLGDGVVLRRELEALEAFNRRAGEIARAAGARLVPIHDRFLGHGLTVPDEDERWYWRHSFIEPSARGASEVRRLWLEALGI